MIVKKYIAKKSIIKSMGNRIPAAVIGFILNAITGIANIDAGPANPPLDMPNKITPIAAVK